MKSFKKYIKEQDVRANQSDMIKKTVDDRDAERAAREADILARTLDGEARGEDDEGMRAVAHVINNRARNTGFYPSEIAQQDRQFSTWNQDDPNRERIQNLPTDDEGYQRARRIAVDVLSGRDEDPTGGATHYYNPSIANPDWSSSLTNNNTIGNHTFGNISGEYDGSEKARTYNPTPEGGTRDIPSSPRPPRRPDRSATTATNSPTPVTRPRPRPNLSS